MMKVSANLNMMFQDVPLIERYALAANAGFKLVEVSIPYSEPADKLKAEADKYNLKHTLINSPPGDWSAGFRGFAALPDHVEDFKKSIDTAIQYGKTLGCSRIHIMAGTTKGSDEKTFVENLKFAANKFEQAGFLALIEPINKYSMDGYFLCDYQQALNVLQQVGSSNLKIQYDLFHAQQITGQLSAFLKANKDKIGYIQVAQVPARGHPGTSGELDHAYLFQLLKSSNPEWIIGCEYLQSSKFSDADFKWVKDYSLQF